MDFEDFTKFIYQNYSDHGSITITKRANLTEVTFLDSRNYQVYLGKFTSPKQFFENMDGYLVPVRLKTDKEETDPILRKIQEINTKAMYNKLTMPLR